MTLKDLERVLYFESYIVLDPGLTPLKDRQLLSEEDYLRALGLNVELVNTETSAATEEPPKEPAVERPRLPPAAAE